MAYDESTGDSRCDDCHGSATDCECDAAPTATDWRALVSNLHAVERRFYDATSDTDEHYDAMLEARESLIDMVATAVDAPEALTEWALAHVAHLAIIVRARNAGHGSDGPVTAASMRAAKRSNDSDDALKLWSAS